MLDTRLIAEAPKVPALFQRTLEASLQIEDADRIRTYYFTTRKLLWLFAIGIAFLATVLAGLLFARETAYQKLHDDMERDFNYRIQNFSRNLEERSAKVSHSSFDEIELMPKFETGREVGKAGRYFVSESASSERVTAGVLEVAPGQTLSPPIGAMEPSGDEVLLVHDGEGTISWPGKAVKAKAGSIVFLPSTIVPEISNATKQPLRIEYVRWVARPNLPSRSNRPPMPVRGPK